MKVKCEECGEEFEYTPYMDWVNDYGTLKQMEKEHNFICGECN